MRGCWELAPNREHIARLNRSLCEKWIGFLQTIYSRFVSMCNRIERFTLLNPVLVFRCSFGITHGDTLHRTVPWLGLRGFRFGP